jgi:hypothetical protein
MRTIFIWLCCIIATGAAAQTVVNKSYPVKSGQTVELEFDYPKVIRVSTWDKNEVSITAKVSINDGENDAAFLLEDKTVDGALSIRNRIRDMDKLPRIYTVIQDGKKTTFRTKEQYQAYKGNMGGSRNYISSDGVDIEITLDIKVPANTATNIKATYGIVELVNFNAPATVNATYGGIDATVAPASTGKLQATTSYGQIFTNLDLKLTDKTERDFFTSITAEPGRGPAYILKSTYGNLYLRKQ